MKVIISHTTALRWYLRYDHDMDSRAKVSNQELDSACCPNAKQAACLLRYLGLDAGGLDVLVFAAAARRKAVGVLPHVAVHELPQESFVYVGTPEEDLEVYMVIPELLFVQLARGSSMARAIWLGTTFCACYRYENGSGFGIVQRANRAHPLTNVTRLRSYCEKLPPQYFPRLIRHALPYVCERSRSPKETGLGMLYAMPVRYGGFQVGIVELNKRISLVSATGERVEREPDITIAAKGRDGRWRKVHLDYESNAFHLSAQKRNRDARRRNELAVAGLTHFDITAEQAGDFNYLCALAERIRKLLKVRAVPRIVGDPNSPDNSNRIEKARHAQFELWHACVNQAVTF